MKSFKEKLDNLFLNEKKRRNLFKIIFYKN
jgi:hypothetical protein